MKFVTTSLLVVLFFSLNAQAKKGDIFTKVKKKPSYTYADVGECSEATGSTTSEVEVRLPVVMCKTVNKVEETRKRGHFWFSELLSEKVIASQSTLYSDTKEFSSYSYTTNDLSEDPLTASAEILNGVLTYIQMVEHLESKCKTERERILLEINAQGPTPCENQNAGGI